MILIDMFAAILRNAEALWALVVLIVAGAVAMRIAQVFGAVAYISYVVVFVVLGAFILGWILGETYPTYMKVRAGTMSALIGGIALFVPVYFIARLRKPLLNVAAIAVCPLASLFMIFVVMFLTSFRGV